MPESPSRKNQGCCLTVAASFVYYPRRWMASIGLLLVVAAAVILGLNLFDFTDQSNDDFMIKGRIETRNRDAVRQAEQAVAVDGGDGNEAVVAQSERESDFDLFLIVEDTVGNDIVFDDNRLREMQTVVARVVDDPNYPKLCHKPKAAGGRCAAPTCIVDFSSSSRMERFANSSGKLQPYPVLRPGSSAQSKEDVFLYYVDADAQVRNQTRTSIRQSVEASVPAATPNREAVIDSQTDAAMQAQEATIKAAVTGVQGLRSLFMDRSASKTNRRSNFLRCMFPMGTPLEGFRNPQDREEEQRDKWNDLASGFLNEVNGQWFFQSERGLRPSVFGLQVLRWGFRVVSVTDMFYAIASIVFVYSYLTFHTGSFFVSSLELLQILCSMPLSLLVYKLAYGIDFFQTLHSLSIFIILGIGCDAVFIFVDAWNQAPVDTLALDDDTLVARMHYTYRRSSKALAVTSGTTFAAFMATGMSEIMPIATFGIFSATLVAFNFLLDITFLPAVLVVWERSVRPAERRCCARYCGGRGDGEAESESNDDKSQASVAGDDEEGGPASPKKHASSGSAAKPKSASSTVKLASDAKQVAAIAEGPVDSGGVRTEMSLVDRIDVGAHEAQAARGIERFFRDRCAPAVFSCRYLILVIGFAALAGCTYATTLLKPLSQQEQWFPESFFIGWAMSVQEDHFGATENDRLVELKLTWGVEGINREGTDPYKPAQLGSVVWDSQFTPHTVGAQSIMYRACADIEAGAVGANSKFKSMKACWPRDFESWLQSNGAHYPIDATNSTITGTSTLPGSPSASSALAGCASPSDQKSVFGCALRKFVSSSATGNGHRTNALIGLTKEANATLRISSIVARLDLAFGEPYATNKPILDAWEVFARKIGAEGAPHGAGQVIQTAGVSWAWMQTERALVTSAIQGIAIAVSVALVVLVVSTNSIPVGIFATATIGGIVLTVLATMVAMGWELGTTESVSSVILIGFSVDYTVHIANAYQEAGDFHHDGTPKSRMDRIRAALAEYGVSILAGSVTTLLAGLPLFLGTIMFFSRFATLICTSIAASLVWSLTFLPALLLVAGPERSCGQLSAVLCCRCRPKGATDAQSAGGARAARKLQGDSTTVRAEVEPASATKQVLEAGNTTRPTGENQSKGNEADEGLRPVGSTPIVPLS